MNEARRLAAQPQAGPGAGGRARDDAIPGVAEDLELVVGEVLQEERAHAGEVRGARGGEHLGAGRGEDGVAPRARRSSTTRGG